MGRAAPALKDSVERVRLQIGGIGPGQWVQELCRLGDQNAAIRRFEQAAVVQRGKNCDGSPVTELTERSDRLLFLGKAVSPESGDKSCELVRARR